MKEENRRKMMRDAIPKLKYYESIKNTTQAMFDDGCFLESNTEGMNPAHDELMNFINAKIQDTWMDVKGEKRFDYHVKVREQCVDRFFTDNIVFKTSAEVHRFIDDKTMDRDAKDMYDYDENPYTIPTVEEIDAIMDKQNYSRTMVIFECGDKNLTHIEFTLFREQINY